MSSQAEQTVSRFECRNCGKLFHTQRIMQHEKICMAVYVPRPHSIGTPPADILVSREASPIPPSARFEFPLMLYDMLEDCTFDEDYCRIVSWQPHGLAFKIHSIEELEKILHKWFREKYESFRCLLEQWGFVKLSRGNDRGCFYQKNFRHHLALSRAREKYANIEKDDFLRGMPQYLPRLDEPDLEKESTFDSIISTKKRKTKSLFSLLNEESAKSGKIAKTLHFNKNLSELAIEKPKVSQKKGLRYKEVNKKQCRYCHGMFHPQAMWKHEKFCATRIREIEWNDRDDNKHSKRFRKNELTSRENKSDSSSMKVSYNERCPIAKNDDAKIYNRSALSDESSLSSNDSGCRICGFDDDHANLLLCEGCDTEHHIYCLNPPLDKVPEGDWFCDKCKARMDKAQINVEKLMHKVPPEMQKRFGEICFAKSAENAHWWPALIFDPRSFLNNLEVVELVRKNLGKRYLVFFFENQDAFAAIPKRWIVTWEEGVKKEFDRGKSVRHASKTRKERFQRAMNLANQALADIAAAGYSESETGFDSQFDNDDDENAGKKTNKDIRKTELENSTIFDLDPDFDWKSLREQAYRETISASPSQYPTVIKPAIRKRMKNKGRRIRAQPYIGKKLCYIGSFSDKHKAAFAIECFLKKMKLAFDDLKNGDSSLGSHSDSNDPTDGGKRRSDLKSRGGFQSPSSEISSMNEPVAKAADPSSFGTFTDRKPPMRPRLRRAAKIASKTSLSNEIVHPSEMSKKVESIEKDAGSHPSEMSKKVESIEKDAASRPQNLEHLEDDERDELLLNASLCHYYLLPLSQF